MKSTRREEERFCSDCGGSLLERGAPSQSSGAGPQRGGWEAAREGSHPPESTALAEVPDFRNPVDIRLNIPAVTEEGIGREGHTPPASPDDLDS